MPNLVELLSERFQQRTAKTEKMNELAERSHQGQLSSFSGVFQIPDITENDKTQLESLLTTHAHTSQETGKDFEHLLAITSEIKAINNQAIMLHGERIKKAQAILKNYKDGAFSKWLLSTYGNRQTPYNFLQFYEFYTSLEVSLKKVADEIPKQVIYSLSSRNASPQKKAAFLQQYKGENKQVLLKRLRDTFPLKAADRRSANLTSLAITGLRKLQETFFHKEFRPTVAEKKELKQMIKKLQAHLHD